MPVCCWGRRCWADWGKASSSQVKYAAFWFSDGSVVEYRLRVDHTVYSPGLCSGCNTTSLRFYQGGTWPESNVPSQCGTTPTPAAWRCWTTPSRSKEAWRVWRTSWRRWPTPSASCHDDSYDCLRTALLLFASRPDVLRDLCQGWYVSLPVLFPHLECAFPRKPIPTPSLELMLAGRLTMLQPNKTSNHNAGKLPLIKIKENKKNNKSKLKYFSVMTDLTIVLASQHMLLCWWKNMSHVVQNKMETALLNVLKQVL